MAHLNTFGGRTKSTDRDEPRLSPFGRVEPVYTTPVVPVSRPQSKSVPAGEGEKERALGYTSTSTPTPEPQRSPVPEGEVEYENVTMRLLAGRSKSTEPVKSTRITTECVRKPLENVSDEEAAAIDKNRLKALLELEKQVEREREGFLKQINKQFQDERKLQDKIAKMEDEYQELRKNYLQAMNKVTVTEDKMKMLLNNDGGFYASVAILEEEKAKMKEELRTLKIKQKSLEETNNSLNQILEGLKLNLKNVMDEKVMLVERMNAGLERESQLDEENRKLKEEERKLREEKCGIPGIIKQLRQSSFCIHIYACTTWKQKVKLMRAAIRSQEPNVIQAVTLFLAETLSEKNFFTIISANRYRLALDLYQVYLKQTNDAHRLTRLYTHLERYEDAGLLMLRQSFQEEDVQKRIALLHSCVEFFRKHEQLEWYADELQSKLNEEQLSRAIEIEE